MRGLTLGIAALLIAVPSTSAQALDRSDLRSGSSVQVHRGGGDGHWRGDRHKWRGHRARGDIVIGDWGYDDWDGGRAWEPDSYNDWWHDRPDRAFPRWVQTNQACQRMWWSGGDWRC